MRFHFEKGGPVCLPRLYTSRVRTTYKERLPVQSAGRSSRCNGPHRRVQRRTNNKSGKWGEFSSQLCSVKIKPPTICYETIYNEHLCFTKRGAWCGLTIERVTETSKVYWTIKSLVRGVVSPLLSRYMFELFHGNLLTHGFLLSQFYQI